MAWRTLSGGTLTAPKARGADEDEVPELPAVFVTKKVGEAG